MHTIASRVRSGHNYDKTINETIDDDDDDESKWLYFCVRPTLTVWLGRGLYAGSPSLSSVAVNGNV